MELAWNLSGSSGEVGSTTMDKTSTPWRLGLNAVGAYRQLPGDPAS